MQFAGSLLCPGRHVPLASATSYKLQPFTSLRPVGAIRPPALPLLRPRLAQRRAPAPAAASAQQLASLADGGSSSAAVAQLLQQQLSTHQLVVGELSEGLETPVQLLYLVTLLGFLVVGAYLVVRQVLIRRELEEAAKVLGERVRAGEASSEDYFELGVILLRKKLYTQATKNLEKAKKGWEGQPEELAQVHNALGYALFNQDRHAESVEEYKRAVALQPGYVTAWNNLGDAYEMLKKWQEAFDAYKEALTYDPSNKVAASRSDALRVKLDRLALKP